MQTTAVGPLLRRVRDVMAGFSQLVEICADGHGLTSGYRIRVLPGEPESVRRELRSVQVDGNARPSKLVGRSPISLWAKHYGILAAHPHVLRFAGATLESKPNRHGSARWPQKNGCKLSDSLLNSPTPVTQPVAFRDRQLDRTVARDNAPKVVPTGRCCKSCFFRPSAHAAMADHNGEPAEAEEGQRDGLRHGRSQVIPIRQVVHVSQVACT